MAFVTPQPGTAGQVYTAAAHNVIVDDLNYLYSPPICQVIRSTDLTSYSSQASISWSSAPVDTDGMWSSGTASRITIKTAGVYSIAFYAYLSGSATISSIVPRIKIDGTSTVESTTPVLSNTIGVGTVTLILSLTVNQYVEFDVSVTGGSNYVVNGAATDSFERTKAAVAWIGAGV